MVTEKEMFRNAFNTVRYCTAIFLDAGPNIGVESTLLATVHCSSMLHHLAFYCTGTGTVEKTKCVQH